MSSYEGVFILDIQGKEEGVEAGIEAVRSAIETEGGKVNSVQRMDSRRFERTAQKLETGYYCTVLFDLASTKLDAVRAKLKLDNKVFRQFYLKKELKKAA
jgi:small subunit ribosomal protein S6